MMFLLGKSPVSIARIFPGEFMTADLGPRLSWKSFNNLQNYWSISVKFGDFKLSTFFKHFITRAIATSWLESLHG